MNDTPLDRVPARASGPAWPPPWLSTDEPQSIAPLQTSALGREGYPVNCGRPNGSAKFIYGENVTENEGISARYFIKGTDGEQPRAFGDIDLTVTWEDAELPIPCSKCGALKCWQDAGDRQRCVRCDPPRTALRMLRSTARIRRALGISLPEGTAEFIRGLERAIE